MGLTVYTPGWWSVIVRCGSARVVHVFHYHGGRDAHYTEPSRRGPQSLLAQDGC